MFFTVLHNQIEPDGTNLPYKLNVYHIQQQHLRDYKIKCLPCTATPKQLQKCFSQYHMIK